MMVPLPRPAPDRLQIIKPPGGWVPWMQAYLEGLGCHIEEQERYDVVHLPQGVTVNFVGLATQNPLEVYTFATGATIYTKPCPGYSRREEVPDLLYLPKGAQEETIAAHDCKED